MNKKIELCTATNYEQLTLSFLSLLSLLSLLLLLLLLSLLSFLVIMELLILKHKKTITIVRFRPEGLQLRGPDFQAN